jgi:hypothetical protein
MSENLAISQIYKKMAFDCIPDKTCIDEMEHDPHFHPGRINPPATLRLSSKMETILLKSPREPGSAKSIHGSFMAKHAHHLQQVSTIHLFEK